MFRQIAAYVITATFILAPAYCSGKQAGVANEENTSQSESNPEQDGSVRKLGPPPLEAPFDAAAIAAARSAWAGWEGVEPELTNSIGMKFVLIPPGTFQMGSPENEAGHIDNELPQVVKLSQPYFLGVHEITQSQYEQVMGKNPSYFSKDGDHKARVAGMKTENFPVEMVSWEDAQEFIKRLNDDETERNAGRRYRLPSEAEWEYACRAGTEGPFSFGKSLNGDKANCNGNSPYGTEQKGTYLDRTCNVGSYAANGFGLYDMHGNVWEWCEDWYDSYENSPSWISDPRGPASGSSRVMRGGSWPYDATYCRSANRGSNDPSDRYNYGGFRVVCGLE